MVVSEVRTRCPIWLFSVVPWWSQMFSGWFRDISVARVITGITLLLLLLLLLLLSALAPCLFNIHFNIKVPSNSGSPNLIFLWGFLTEILYVVYFLSIIQFFCLHCLNTVVIFGKQSNYTASYYAICPIFMILHLLYQDTQSLRVPSKHGYHHESASIIHT